MKKIMIAGNWKMNKTDKEAVSLAKELVDLVGDIGEPKVVLCPPFTSLKSVGDVISGSKLYLGAQNLFWEEHGAYTGEISPAMLTDLGCKYVIIGHSERRKYFGETDESVNKRLKAALLHKLVPILCVGETLEERDKGVSKDVVKRQVVKGLKGIDFANVGEFVVAYEPVWAIGTGIPATGEDAEDMINFIKTIIQGLIGSVDDRFYFLYGGSVKPDNITEFISKPAIQGALVGGASLKADQFAGIVKKSSI